MSTINPPTMRDLIDRVDSVRNTLSDAARQGAMARLAKRGRLSARERIARLVDPGSFSEVGGLVTAEDDGIGAKDLAAVERDAGAAPALLDDRRHRGAALHRHACPRDRGHERAKELRRIDLRLVGEPGGAGELG